MNEKIKELEELIESLELEKHQMRQRILGLQAALDAVHSPFSVKITAPLRFVRVLPIKIIRFLDRFVVFCLCGVEKSLPKHARRFAKRQLLVDCSFIHGTELNTGIQRVVRNVVANLLMLEDKYDIKVCPVSLTNGTVSLVDMTDGRKVVSDSGHGLFGIFFFKFKMRLNVYKDLFAEKLEISAGDMLLMLDSTWHLNIWESIHSLDEKGVTIIGVTYDLIPIDYPFFFDETLVMIFKDWYRLSLKYFDGYISISKTVMGDVKKYIEANGRNSGDYQLDFFNMGSDINLMSQNNATIDSNLKKIFIGKSVYLTISTVEPRKNHILILDAFEKIWAEGGDACWVIVGKLGWKVTKLIERINKHKEFGKRLFMFNSVDDQTLAYCYAHSKALIFASIVEGFGLPIIEGLKMGLPVLVSDTPIHREVGKNNADYFSLDSPGNLCHILQDIESGKRTLKFIEPTSVHVNTWSEATEGLLKKIISMDRKIVH